MRHITMVRIATYLGLTLLVVPALRAVPSAADKSYETATQLLRVGNDQQALDELQRFVSTYPNDARFPQASLLLGISCQQLQKYDKAVAAYTQVIAKTATDQTPTGIELRARAHFQLGECYLAQADYDKAAKSYGNFLQLSDRVSLAKRDADFMASWQASLIAAQYRKAESLYLAGHNDDALQEYTKFLAAYPTDPLAPWACYQLGSIELNQSKFTEAIAAFERVGSDYTTSEIAGEAAFADGLAYAGRARNATMPAPRDTDYRKAVDIFTGVLANDHATTNSKVQAALVLAEAYTALGDATSAGAAYTRALTFIAPTAPQAASIRLQLGHTLYNAGRYDEADQAYSGVIANAKDAGVMADAQYWLGVSAYQLATTAKNAQAYGTAVSALTSFLTPEHDKDARAPQAALLLAFCYEDQYAAGNKDAGEKAKTAYMRVLQQWPTADQAVQARGGITRLSRSMTPEQLRQLTALLPVSMVSWDITLQLAYKEYTAGHFENALAAARQVLDGKPGVDVAVQAAYLVGVAQQKLGRAKDAIPFYRQVLTSAPTGTLAPYAQRALVQAYLDTRDFANARDAALALSKLPTTATGDEAIANEQAERLTYLASAYLGNRQYAEALESYHKVASDYPHSALLPNALMNIAWIAETQKDTAHAIATYQDFIARFPDHELVPDAFYQLGVDYEKQGEYDKAIAAFQNVPESSKLADQAAYAIAWAYWDSKQQEKALAQFTLLTEKFPQSPLAADGWYRLGAALMDAKDYAGALRYFSRALDLTTDANLTPVIAYQLGVSAYQAEQYAMAANAFGKIIANYPDNTYAADSLFWKAQSQEKQGATQALAARDAYLQYVAKYPAGDYVADAMVGAMRAALTTGQSATARADAQKATDLFATLDNGDNATLAERAKSLGGEVQFTVAQSYFAEKNYQQALREYAGVSIYKYEPWYSRSYLQIARCNALLGDKQSAVSTLQLLQRVAPDSEAAKQVPDVAKELGLTL